MSFGIRLHVLHGVVGDDVDVDAAVGLEPDGDHHDEEVKDGVLAFADNLPIKVKVQICLGL